MKKKQIIAGLICLVFAFSSIGTALTIFADIDINEIASSFFNASKKDEPADTSGEIKQEPNAIPATEERVSMDVPAEEGILYEGTRASIDYKDPLLSDQYHITETDIEELVKEGYSVEDIFKADEIGNKLDIQPKELLKQKKEKNKDLDEIKAEIEEDREIKALGKLAEKYPDIYKQLVEENFDKTGMLGILGFCDANDVKSIKELIKDYKQEKEAAFAKHENKKNNASDKQKMSKYDLGDEEIEGISEEVLAKIEKLHEKTNIPMKDLVKKYKEQNLSTKGEGSNE